MRSLKQQLLLLVIGPLLLLSVSLSLVTGLHMKDGAILATDSKAKSDLATGEAIIDLMYPGPWRVVEGVLYKGDIRISNNSTPVDKISKLTGDTVTIFLGDTRVTTTVTNKGQRVIGTKASDAVSRRVLKDGREYLGQADVVGQLYQTAYKPIRDDNGKIIGMFYVGINKKLSDELIHNPLISLIGISIGLTLLVALIAFYFNQKVIIGPLRQITEGTRDVATGNPITKVEVHSSKEIDDLADAFNQMVEGMQNLAVQIARTTGNNDNIPEPVANPTEAGERSEAVNKVLTEELPKGLNETTLKQIIGFLENMKEPMSAEEIGEGIKITRVTARRYLEYLEQNGWVEVELRYGTVGRPVKLYKLTK